MFPRPKTPICALVALLSVMACAGNNSEGEEGQTLKVPGDSVRLEDTLSAPPASDSVRAQ